MNAGRTTILAATLFASFTAPRALPHDPPQAGCEAAPRELAHEIELMQSRALPTPRNAAGPPRLYTNQHYALTLRAQKDFVFAVPPGRAAHAGQPRGGVFVLEPPVAGRYRVSITSRHWIDILDGGHALQSVGSHRPGCGLVHKIVEFDLPAARTLTLQLSGQEDAIVGLAITLVES